MLLNESERHPKACDVLEWDSAFFGCRIARYRQSRLTSDGAAAMLTECVEGGFDCVYFLVDASDTESIDNLQKLRASLVDIRVTFGTHIRSAGDLEPTADRTNGVRLAIGSDIPRLRQIAAVSHRDTRFHADKHFDPERSDRLYEVWIENSCNGYADAVLVAEDDAGQPEGYVTCHRGEADTGHIGLFAVREDARGRGIGRALLNAALIWFSTNRMTAMTVATQLRNVGALRLYGRAGLLITAVGLSFHFWPRDVNV